MCAGGRITESYMRHERARKRTREIKQCNRKHHLSSPHFLCRRRRAGARLCQVCVTRAVAAFVGSENAPFGMRDKARRRREARGEGERRDAISKSSEPLQWRQPPIRDCPCSAQRKMHLVGNHAAAAMYRHNRKIATMRSSSLNEILLNRASCRGK